MASYKDVVLKPRATHFKLRSTGYVRLCVSGSTEDAPPDPQVSIDGACVVPIMVHEPSGELVLVMGRSAGGAVFLGGAQHQRHDTHVAHTAAREFMEESMGTVHLWDEEGGAMEAGLCTDTMWQFHDETPRIYKAVNHAITRVAALLHNNYHAMRLDMLYDKQDGARRAYVIYVLHVPWDTELPQRFQHRRATATGLGSAYNEVDVISLVPLSALQACVEPSTPAHQAQATKLGRRGCLGPMQGYTLNTATCVLVALRYWCRLHSSSSPIMSAARSATPAVTSNATSCDDNEDVKDAAFEFVSASESDDESEDEEETLDWDAVIIQVPVDGSPPPAADGMDGMSLVSRDAPGAAGGASSSGHSATRETQSGSGSVSTST